MASTGIAPTVGPMTGINSPIAARIASGSAYGMRSATSPTNVAMPMIAESSSCAESQELIRLPMRISMRRRSPRTSGG